MASLLLHCHIDSPIFAFISSVKSRLNLRWGSNIISFSMLQRAQLQFCLAEGQKNYPCGDLLIGLLDQLQSIKVMNAL